MKGLILETGSDNSFALLAADGLVLRTLPLGGGPQLSKNLGLRLRGFIENVPLDFIAIGIGPGSYTGIRVGAAMAQALAYSLKIPLLPFSGALATDPSTLAVHCCNEARTCSRSPLTPLPFVYR